MSDESSNSFGWNIVVQECVAESKAQSGFDDPVFPTSSSTQQSKRGGRRKVGSKLLRQHVAKIAAESIDTEEDSKHPPLQGIAYARQCRLEASVKKQQELQKAKSKSLHSSGSMVDTTMLSSFGHGETLLMVGSSFQRAAGATILKILQRDVDLNDEVLDQTLSGKTLTSSSQAVGSLVDKSQKHVQNKLLRAGAALCETGTWLWGGFLTRLLGTGFHPLLFVLRLRYDETPTKVRVVETPKDGHVFAPKSKIGTELLAQIMASMSTLPEHEAKPATHAKILQTELQIAVLLKQPTGKFLCIHGPVPTSLQAVDHLTGETTRACVWSSISAIPEVKALEDVSNAS